MPENNNVPLVKNRKWKKQKSAGRFFRHSAFLHSRKAENREEN
ncbi:hypothetical protein PEC301645_06990 [Pectobacterium carotovorum subsp. carotovorum]|jgi:hypothetical protein|nr:hypothetical protein [Pectobacterium carotovorum subsp. carotovorum PCCS1]GKV93252.1 hypothetical protein PEC301645_06990 [Pectobacterium carotovorum subsp. carotovorum]